MHEDRTQSFIWNADEGRAQRVIAFWDGGCASTLLDSEPIVVGRSLECGLTVLHASVSRRHVEIRGGATPRVRDLESANGTRLSGRLLRAGEEADLHPGDVIEIGSAMVMVRSAVDTAPLVAPRASGSMAQVKKLVELVASSVLSVIVLGETGVGKELTAQTIHDRSPRASAPFVRVNCAALTESLLDSELFGYEKGAFTGATSTKVGLIEAADKGTLFLDEIGEAPLSVQAKLLRTLESREVRRVGGVEPRIVDVRFVVATNRDLPSRVESGTFRRDLYYRLNGITIVVPPLRERRDEVLGLAQSFANGASPGRVPVLSREAASALMTHPFAGNVRELRNVMERAVVLAAGGEIRAAHLLLDGARVGDAAPVDDERQRIVRALEQTSGNQTRAAEILGVSRRTLINRMEVHGVPRPRKG